MSAIDARAADVFLAGYRPAPLTRKERAAAARDREARTLKRLTVTIEQRLTMFGCVTERDLQDFTAAEIERYFTRARRAARVEIDA
jgi:hypothetical protein